MAQATEYGINLGNVLSEAEQIAEARISNRLAARAMQDEEALRAQRGNVLAGSNSPLAGMAAIDPAAANDVRTFLNGLSEDDRKVAEQNVDQIGRMAAFVLTSDDPEKAYQQVYASIDPKVRTQTKMPSAYDEGWVKLQLANAQSVDEIIKADAQALTDLNKDAPSGYQWTDKTKSALRPVKGGPHDPAVEGAKGGLETGIINAIRSTVTGQFDGFYDPQTGEIGFADPTQAGRALAVMAEAEANAMKGDTPAIAVQKAMKTVEGLTPAVTETPAPSTTTVNPADPLGLGL